MEPWAAVKKPFLANVAVLPPAFVRVPAVIKQLEVYEFESHKGIRGILEINTRIILSVNTCENWLVVSDVIVLRASISST